MMPELRFIFATLFFPCNFLFWLHGWFYNQGGLSHNRVDLVEAVE
uniref:Uncharacterized protein n=1 Tax=Rhizophora mucronata TaxID=61149 RepID=A0A2P2NZL0_RHIMU